MTNDPVIAWLLATDPAIAWQVQRDLLDASEDVWRPLRSRVEHEGWGARLLAHQDSDGQWAGGAFFPHDFSRELWEAEGQPWTATTYALTDPREWGLDPTSETATAQPTSSGATRDGIMTVSPIGLARSRNASTAAPSPMAPTSGRT